MKPDLSPRVSDAEDLGRDGRGFDIALGVAAILPIGALCLATAIVDLSTLPLVRIAAALWTGCLLAFLSGVRRGLSFSEEGGARPAEIASFLLVFLIALVTVAFRSPVVAALGLVLVGALDWAAARRGQAPRYFRRLRPAQMLFGALGLLFIAAQAGA